MRKSAHGYCIEWIHSGFSCFLAHITISRHATLIVWYKPLQDAWPQSTTYLSPTPPCTAQALLVNVSDMLNIHNGYTKDNMYMVIADVFAVTVFACGCMSNLFVIKVRVAP